MRCACCGQENGLLIRNRCAACAKDLHGTWQAAMAAHRTASARFEAETGKTPLAAWHEWERWLDRSSPEAVALVSAFDDHDRSKVASVQVSGAEG